jgi:hypothetical protein
MSIEHRRKLGFSGISSKMRPRYVEALTLGIEFFQYGKRNRPEIGAWLGDLKGMYTRCFKRDQTDWYAVWTILGEPNDLDSKRISGWLQQVGRSMKSNDPTNFNKYFHRIPRHCLDDWSHALDVLADDDAPIHSHIVQNPNFNNSSPELILGEKRLLWSPMVLPITKRDDESVA